MPRRTAIAIVALIPLVAAGCNDGNGRGMSGEAQVRVPQFDNSLQGSRWPTGDIDLSYLPDDAKGFIIIRPAATLGHPAFAEMRGLLPMSIEGNSLPWPLPEIEQITLVPLAVGFSAGCSITQASTPSDLEDFISRSFRSGREEEMEGRTVLRAGRSLTNSLYRPNDKVAVVGNTPKSMKWYLKSSCGTLPAFITQEQFESFREDAAVLAIDLVALHKELENSTDPIPDYLLPFVVLSETATSAIFSVQLADNMVVRGMIVSKDDQSAVTLRHMVDAWRNMGRGRIKTGRHSVRSGEDSAFLFAALDLLDQVFERATVENEGNLVHVTSSADGARLVKVVRAFTPNHGKARPVQRKPSSKNSAQARK